MFHSPIIRLTAGVINQINDDVIAGISGISGQSKYSQQLGNGIWLDDNNILFNSAIGTVFGGHFRYVRLAAGATTPVQAGQIVFWDPSVADNLFQVTTAESGSVDPAALRAGIVLNPAWGAGKYSVIQDVGPTYVKFRAALSSAGANGCAAYCAGVGGADLGLADCVASGTPVTTVEQRLFLGTAPLAPTNGSLSLVYLSFYNVKG